VKQFRQEQYLEVHSNPNEICALVNWLAAVSSGHILKIQLVAVNIFWDLAVFRIVEKPAHDEKKIVIDWSQMFFVKASDRGKLETQDYWWSVGYNFDYAKGDIVAAWQQFMTRQTTELRQKIRQQYVSGNPEVTFKIDLLCRVLTKSQLRPRTSISSSSVLSASGGSTNTLQPALQMHHIGLPST
jgi:hypothetical protein